jgi:prenylated cyclic peptide (anacyclamide/piricyclamide family)
MTKKNIRPQQVAPVERETISTAKDQSGLVTPQRVIIPVVYKL